MGERIAALTNWLGGLFTSFGALLEDIGHHTAKKARFVNLAPTDQADKDGVYSEALLFATTDPKVKNIALTGPYGSGKSSIIQSFLKRYRTPPLHISLAAFVKEASPPSDKEARATSLNVTRQEIERSILQQMLYGADANKLPLSRFKRIQSPGVLSIFKSLYIMFGLLSLWYVFTKREPIISGTFFDPLALSNWPHFTVFGFSLLFLWVALHNLYVASFGLSLKSISLKDIEIRPASDNLESILNRHLDEIIYFFQSTKYDLVIFEDLDRFEDAEIFVTLREINSLVNANAGVRRTIRFLYALRDDVFVNTDRTKFFEFIIPVIPIINASNSIDMVLKQGKRLELDGRLDPQFLREVSRYLNDLRLIQNIFNEYAIYVANLETDDDNTLDANKLLAILIYKNVYPRDFEQLHRGEGNLANILGRRDELVSHAEGVCKTEMAELEQKIDIAERQTPSNLKELRRIYAMALIEKLPPDVYSVSPDGQAWIKVNEIIGRDALEQIIAGKTVFYRNVYNHSQRTDISTLQHEVDSEKSYLQRKIEIENKYEANKSESLRRIRELRAKIATLRTTRFNELVRSGAEQVVGLFDGFREKGELARFLILEGHLDDSYYQYTSLFHSGRLSPNDNKFLRQIRAFDTPDPDFQIDNPNEVIAAMREADFGQSYVLNVKLVDCLLSDATRYRKQIGKFFEFITSQFEGCEDFFEAYYTSGRAVPELLSRLADEWEQFVPTAIASKRNLSHVTQLLTNLPELALEPLVGDGEEFPDFVVARLPEILTLAPDLAPERLEHIGIEIRDLPAIGRFTGIVRFMARRGLFELSIANLEHVYSEVLGETNLRAFRERNYTTLRSLTDPALIKRVERDLDLYLNDVLLNLHDNAEEDAAAIVDLLGRGEVDEDKLREFIGRQAALLPTLEGVPEKFHAMVFELRRIVPTWENCISFMASSGFAAEVLVAFLDCQDVRAAILSHHLPGVPKTLLLRQFLVNANALSDDGYREYVRALPNTFKNFPQGLDPSKLATLIEERKISFSKESLESLDISTDLPVLFVAENIRDYLADPGMFGLDDDFRERLLRAAITDDDKRAILDLIDLTTLTELPNRAALIGPILDRTNVSISGLDAAKARSLILNSRPVETQISLFNKFHSTMAASEARDVLAALPAPFSEITTGYHIPRLPRSDENRALVQWLEAGGIISSWSEGGGWFISDEIRVNLRRR
ncbi:ATP-binding protein [Rhizobium bangladeshense]|uniref:YobI family P-loop NTPase n=1 Tax=Rhizobium bangladeshense TaxID=1138189 RepID=UPI001C83BA8A|nr:ATP-binding protein [Rhizobium bangladeshense]MBX4903517.1 ATP-binding protein [Rhizobium bangladeshense]